MSSLVVAFFPGSSCCSPVGLLPGRARARSLAQCWEHLLNNCKAGKRKQRDGQPDPFARADRTRPTGAVGAYRKAGLVSSTFPLEENDELAWAKELISTSSWSAAGLQ